MALTRAQALTCEMEGDQRRGTSGIDGNTWPNQSKHIRETTSSDAPRITRPDIAIQVAEVRRAEHPVIERPGRETNKHACQTLSKLGGRVTSALECLPTDL